MVHICFRFLCFIIFGFIVNNSLVTSNLKVKLMKQKFLFKYNFRVNFQRPEFVKDVMLVISKSQFSET